MLQIVREYLENNYPEHITLEHLAQLSGLNQFELVRVFHQQLGIPPHAYLIHIRVEQAKVLLASSNYSVGQVALSTGFVDQSHLTKNFKRIVGTTPGQYRLVCKNVQDK